MSVRVSFNSLHPVASATYDRIGRIPRVADLVHFLEIVNYPRSFDCQGIGTTAAAAELILTPPDARSRRLNPVKKSGAINAHMTAAAMPSQIYDP
jgi:hypothetical protein